jgi:hypothetical protein
LNRLGAPTDQGGIGLRGGAFGAIVCGGFGNAFAGVLFLRPENDSDTGVQDFGNAAQVGKRVAFVIG